ncbi:hypothetical protein ACOSQ3_013377 [Xanthoceras sorbifolium]
MKASVGTGLAKKVPVPLLLCDEKEGPDAIGTGVNSGAVEPKTIRQGSTEENKEDINCLLLKDCVEMEVRDVFNEEEVCLLAPESHTLVKNGVDLVSVNPAGMEGIEMDPSCDSSLFSPSSDSFKTGPRKRKRVAHKGRHRRLYLASQVQFKG